MCAHESLTQGGFQQRGLWVDLTSLPFWPPRSILVGKVSSTSRIRNMWSLIFVWAGLSLLTRLPCSFRLGVLVHRRWTPTAYPAGCGVAIYLLSQFIIFISFFDHLLRCSCQEWEITGQGYDYFRLLRYMTRFLSREVRPVYMPTSNI